MAAFGLPWRFMRKAFVENAFKTPNSTVQPEPRPAVPQNAGGCLCCAGIAYITYNLPCRYCFACGNGSLRHVGVPCGQARTVIQQHLIAVAVVPATDQHRAAVGSQDMCALWHGNVSAAMSGIAEGVHLPEMA